MLDAPGGQEYIPVEGDLPDYRYLLVALGDEEVALPAEAVLEVITARPYGKIPGAESCVAGVVNRRGRILTVVDLGLALGGRASRSDPAHRIVVVSFGGREIGLAVRDVLRFAEEYEEGGEAERPRIVEVESLLAPLFGGGSGGGGTGGEPSFERP